MRALAVASLIALLAGCAAPRDTAGPAPAPEPSTPPADTTPEAVGPPAWESVEALVLAAPPWDHVTRDEVGRRAVVVPRLTRISETPNSITDEEAWLRRNGLIFPGSAQPSREVPFLFGGEARSRVIEQPGWTIAVYGAPTGGRYLLIAGDDGTRRAFDFGAYSYAPAGEGASWPQDLVWAAIEGDRLYVTHAHPTYAETTGGQNGYATALDLATGELRWRSRPLVANARTFEVVDDALVTGYGFTAEPDWLYVIDRYTGEVLSETRVRTAATWIFLRGDRLLVRAYDADYEFAVR